jgi:hypothetical protein
MSIYDTIQKIAGVTDIKHTVSPDKVIARFYVNNNVIKYYFSEYNSSILSNHLSFNYDKIEIDYQFWNPYLCKADMLMPENIKYFETLDVFRDEVSHSAAAGFVLSLIGVYNIIFQSYSSKFDEIVKTVDFDKQIIKKVFQYVDIVVGMPDSLLQFIKTIFNEDILDAMITPSGNFRFVIEDLTFMAHGTYVSHEISSLVDRYILDDLEKLRYYMAILTVCGPIQPPYQLNTTSDTNIMLNICKLNINIERNYKLIQRVVSLYFDKGGTLVPVNFIPEQRYTNFSIILQTFKNLHSGYSPDSF